MIPLLDTLVKEGVGLGVEEMVMGMAHRGRLNVLAHVLRKPYELILSEFEEIYVPQEGESDGDVKYHLGFSCDHAPPEGAAPTFPSAPTGFAQKVKVESKIDRFGALNLQ